MAGRHTPIAMDDPAHGAVRRVAHRPEAVHERCEKGHGRSLLGADRRAAVPTSPAQVSGTGVLSWGLRGR
jgi:hypothetical protein